MPQVQEPESYFPFTPYDTSALQSKKDVQDEMMRMLAYMMEFWETGSRTISGRGNPITDLEIEELAEY